MKKPKAPKPGNLVLVEWEDSCSPATKWQDKEIGETLETEICTSVGWITHNDKKRLVLAASRSTDQIGEVTAIPASCVKKVRPLK